ncbi:MULTISPECIES: PfkB family carbohydrate kinase [Streptomyces]|jgi:sugar/nucleoside kinase (ribokinase family)|uniref:Carbohydrate kinase family protein n=1 Tax=Streptomyces virens TaxID=285572 RepID=A0ABP6P0C8_9ACTN|nr:MULTISPECIES: PfkB family carbohydrate kinase [Streptomyces]MBA8975267.1 sugar/nucleoside kinase (ribokinase family) [Streptomyces calvus]MYS31540.1 adenosine kinase [Streptomyces sp. SID7804]
MTAEIDVLVVGGAGVDTIVHVPELPVPLADSHMIHPGIVTRAGQSGDFVALGTSALGLRTHHIDLIGDDHEGDLVRALHRDHGIALTAVPQPCGTKRAVNLVGPDGRRLSLYDATRWAETDRLPERTLHDLAAASRHAHVVITQPCAHALPVLRAAGVTVSTDLHDWDGTNPYHEPFALAADLVFLSAAALPDPEATLRRIAARGRARVVVATAGADGAFLLHDDELTHVPPAEPPAPVVDSNGAGDAFAAAFLWGWLGGRPPRHCARLGAVAGAYACTVPSTRVAAIGPQALLAGVTGPVPGTVSGG